MYDFRVLSWLVLLVMAGSVSGWREYTTRSTKLGEIKGIVSSVMGVRTENYLGIRYAKSPTGKLRFAKPQAAEAWGDAFEATSYGHHCATWSWDSVSGDEDCLTLNIFVPLIGENKNKSVLLYIHGGGFNGGSAKDANTTMMSALDVITVTINYRLGVLGFLATSDGKLEGEFGMWDQHMAIKWVHDNIEDYGGDPNRVTLMGQSAGSTSVSHQMLSPHNNRTLFQRGIAMSGTVPDLCLTKYNIFGQSNDIIEAAGCSKTIDLLKCLRTLSLEKVLSPTNTNDFYLPARVNSEFLPFDPCQTDNLTNFQHFGQYDYMGSWNSQEGLYYHYLIERYSRELEAQRNYNWDGITEEIVDKILDYEQFPIANPQDLQRVKTMLKNFYMSHLDERFEKDPIGRKWSRVITELTGDLPFIMSQIRSLIVHSKVSTNAKTYGYEFDYRTSRPDYSTNKPDWLRTGSDHGDESVYLFGYPFAYENGTEDYAYNYYYYAYIYYDYNYPDAELQLSKDFISSIVNFVKYGNPSDVRSSYSIPFQEFTPDEQTYTHIGGGDQYTLKKKPRHEHLKLWEDIDRLKTYGSLSTPPSTQTTTSEINGLDGVVG